jgi:hypothetical protein
LESNQLIFLEKDFTVCKAFRLEYGKILDAARSYPGWPLLSANHPAKGDWPGLIKATGLPIKITGRGFYLVICGVGG